jgi:Leucine-rich repeat (LRR) protein
MKRRNTSQNGSIKSPPRQDKEKFKHVQVDSHLQVASAISTTDASRGHSNNSMGSDLYEAMMKRRNSSQSGSINSPRRQDKEKFKHVKVDSHLQAKLQKRRLAANDPSVESGTCADDESEFEKVKSPIRSTSDLSIGTFAQEYVVADASVQASERSTLQSPLANNVAESSVSVNDLADKKDQSDNVDDTESDDHFRSDGGVAAYNTEDYVDEKIITSDDNESCKAGGNSTNDEAYNTEDDAVSAEDSGDEDLAYNAEDDPQSVDSGDDDGEYNTEDDAPQIEDTGDEDFFAPPDDQLEASVLDDADSDSQCSQEEDLEDISDRREEEENYGEEEYGEVDEMEEQAAQRSFYKERTVYNGQTEYDEEMVATAEAEQDSSASEEGDQLHESTEDNEQELSDDEGETDIMYENGSVYSGDGSNDAWSVDEQEGDSTGRALGDHMNSAPSSFDHGDGERITMGELTVLNVVDEEATVDDSDNSTKSIVDDNVFGGKIVDGKVDRDIPSGDDDDQQNEISNSSQVDEEAAWIRKGTQSEQAPPDKRKKRLSQRCSWPWKVTAVLLCSIAIGVGIGVFLLSGSKKSNTSNAAQKEVPVPVPTASPSRDPKLANLSAVSLATYDLICPVLVSCAGLLDLSAPQGRAFDWLVNKKDANPLLEQIPNATKIRRYALATFYFSTKGDSWANNTDWLSDKNDCVWFSTSASGQGCDIASTDFTALELDKNNVQGELPYELALLTSLTSLSLQNPVGTPPYIRGSISSHLGALTSLTSVVIAGNQFSGGIPAELGKWINVATLDLSNNGVNGAIPTAFASLTKLTTLNLEGNYFSGNIDPSVFVGASGLIEVNLENNQLTGIPTSIMGLAQLRSLNIGANKLATFPLAVTQLFSLSHLDLRENGMAGQIPVELGGMKSLKGLILEGNQFTGNIPVELGNLVQLTEVLDLSSNVLTGPVPSRLGQLVALKRLLLNGNKLNGELPVELAALSMIEEIRINDNNIIGAVPQGICTLLDAKMPAAFADCSELNNATCFTFCCTDGAGCVCRYENTDPLKCIKQVYVNV